MRLHRLERAASRIEFAGGVAIASRVLSAFYASLIGIDVSLSFHSFFGFAPPPLSTSLFANFLIIALVASLISFVVFSASIPTIKCCVRSYRARVSSMRSLAEISAINAASACLTLRTSTRSALAARIVRVVRAAASRRLLGLSHRARASIASAMQSHLISIISTRAQTSTLRAAAARAAASSV